MQQKFLDTIHGLSKTEFPFHGGNSFVNKSAGMDIPEIIEIGVHVQGKSVHRNGAADFNTDRTDLPGPLRTIAIQPDAGGSFQAGCLYTGV